MTAPRVEETLYYLVELSAPEAGWKDVDRVIRRAREAADGSNDDASFVRAIFVPESSSCFLLYEATSPAAAAAAAARIDVGVERVSEVLRTTDEEEHAHTVG
ncbi:MAG: hypothetical protein ACRDKT_01960 [Actinomycetota bacterium]